MDQGVEKQSIEESSSRPLDALTKAAGRAVKWLVTGFITSLLLLVTDFVVGGVSAQARPKADFLGSFGAWVLRGDLLVLAASLSAAVLIELLFFSQRKHSGSGSLFIAVPRGIFGLWCFIVLVISVSLVPLSINYYHDALNRIYADAYVPAYEEALSRERRVAEPREGEDVVLQRVHEEANTTAEKELNRASLVQIERSYPLSVAYCIWGILGLLVSAVVCGAILLALEI